MEKYKIIVKEQTFTFEDIEDLKRKVRAIMEIGVWAIETKSIHQEEEIVPIDSKKGIEQRDRAREKMLEKAEKEIKPVKIDPKIKRMAETPPGKRFRRTKAEMEEARGKEPKSDVQDGRKIGKYPKEMKDFIERHMETNSNQAITDLINEKWDLGITMDKVKNYMKYNQLKRVNIIRSPRRKKTENPGEKKKLGKPKKYTDEVVEFLRENINNFSNKELCEELESRFNIKTHPLNLNGVLSQRGIKRDHQTGVDHDIVKFIEESKIKDAYVLRDKIIEKFEKNIPMAKVRDIMGKQDFPGESVEEEVKRIKQKRDTRFDKDVDDLDLD